MESNTFKALRLQRNMTQVEFGELLGMSQSTIANIEAGRRAISDTVRARLAQVGGIDEEFNAFLFSLKKIENTFPLKHNMSIGCCQEMEA